MFELWARRNDTRRYEYITSFDNENQKYYLINQLDKSIYYEVVVMENERCNLYEEFKQQQKKTLKKNKNML